MKRTLIFFGILCMIFFHFSSNKVPGRQLIQDAADRLHAHDKENNEHADADEKG